MLLTKEQMDQLYELGLRRLKRELTWAQIHDQFLPQVSPQYASKTFLKMYRDREGGMNPTTAQRRKRHASIELAAEELCTQPRKRRKQEDADTVAYEGVGIDVHKSERPHQPGCEEMVVPTSTSKGSHEVSVEVPTSHESGSRNRPGYTSTSSAVRRSVRIQSRCNKEHRAENLAKQQSHPDFADNPNGLSSPTSAPEPASAPVSYEPPIEMSCGLETGSVYPRTLTISYVSRWTNASEAVLGYLPSIPPRQPVGSYLKRRFEAWSRAGQMKRELGVNLAGTSASTRIIGSSLPYGIAAAGVPSDDGSKRASLIGTSEAGSPKLSRVPASNLIEAPETP